MASWQLLPKKKKPKRKNGRELQYRLGTSLIEVHINVLFEVRNYFLELFSSFKYIGEEPKDDIDCNKIDDNDNYCSHVMLFLSPVILHIFFLLSLA